MRFWIFLLYELNSFFVIVLDSLGYIFVFYNGEGIELGYMFRYCLGWFLIGYSNDGWEVIFLNIF